MGPTQTQVRNGPPPTLVAPGPPVAGSPPPQVAAPNHRSRHLWVGLIPGMVALVVMLVFIFQNLRASTVSFFGFSGAVPLGVALVAAALLGGLVVFGFGSVRIVQLRRLARRGGRRP